MIARIVLAQTITDSVFVARTRVVSMAHDFKINSSETNGNSLNASIVCVPIEMTDAVLARTTIVSDIEETTG
jgi:hypothetical protein